MKWMACGLCEATWMPLNNIHCPNVVYVKHNGVVNNRHHNQNTKAKVMATLDGTKVAHTQRVDDW